MVKLDIFVTRQRIRLRPNGSLHSPLRSSSNRRRETLFFANTRSRRRDGQALISVSRLEGRSSQSLNCNTGNAEYGGSSSRVLSTTPNLVQHFRCFESTP
jgi:hypothetical protein